jgi:MoCo/4Fe-4S cofactor protein with predicted Tat translocation signal
VADEIKYWKSLDEREGGADYRKRAADEFPQEFDRPAVQIKRRDFLKLSALTATMATVAGCSRAPVEKAIPFLVQSEEMVPGRSLYYASMCGGCSSGCGVLVKTRDGRAIKLEGNPEHPVSRGGLCAIGQASLLGLYDSQRFKSPQKNGRDCTWEEADRAIMAELAKVRVERGAVRFLSSTVHSPTVNAAIGQFLSGFADARHVQYDAVSSSAILDAHEQTHGVRVLPRYRFDRAEVIVSFDCDFLGTWISPVEFTKQWKSGRDLQARPPRMSEHIQLESRMTLTGSNADTRITIEPDSKLLSALAQAVEKRAGVPGAISGAASTETAAVAAGIAAKLWAARGKSLMISGSNDVHDQVLVNHINHLLGNYGATLDIERPSYQRRGNDAELAALTDELTAGKVRALFIYGANPEYDLPGEVGEAIRKVPFVVSFAQRPDETSALAHWICPDQHFLESWIDAEAVVGVVTVNQPALRPLGNTRAVTESLATWQGKPASAYDQMREQWRSALFARQSREKSFDKFWDAAVYSGFAELDAPPMKSKPFEPAATRAITRKSEPDGDFVLELYPTVALGDGRHAYNAFLQELPDPVSKVTWDNYASVSPATAKKIGVGHGDTVRIEAGEQFLLLPVYIQPGQHDRVVAVALGYGSVMSKRFANVGPQWLEGKPSVGDDGRVGVNVAPLLRLENGTLRYTRGVKVTRGERRYELAVTQDHHTLSISNPLAGTHEPRPIVQETTLAAFAKNASAGAPGEEKETAQLWPADHPYTGHRWAMAIDLTACTGCSACIVACNAENNVPVVGRDEVRRRREMHWLRIDRYYAEREDGEVLAVHQPMMCQQCENASCETVCPVLATVHSEEGLNEQVYNRCVGTRYCANNCAYKTRRFNWFTYAHDDTLQNLALNPDVTVRTRGIMEKCTFCVQRIQEAKAEAKRNDRPLADGAIQTACQQSCPAGAIVFGDINDPNSRISKLAASGRSYKVLEELNVRPSVVYQRVVRNREEKEEKNV